MNLQKRRTGTPDDETTTTIETFPEEEEAEAMVETRILNLKARTVTTAESRDMPKQPVGCFRRAMRVRGSHGLNRRKTVQKPEQPVATETGNKVEYLLMAMEFPTDQKFLDNPDVWIGDTGASVHMSPHRGGMRDLKESKICRCNNHGQW
jgi:hypothetical protein